MVNPHEENCVYKKFYDKILDYEKYLRNFGYIGVVRSIAIVKVKLEDQGMACMFLGYEQNHTGGTYCMFNLCKELILLRHDIVKLKINRVSLYQENKISGQTLLSYKMKTVPIIGLV